MTQAPATPELVERLRTLWSRMGGVFSDKVDRMLAERQEAADALEAQQARIAELEKALKPFERAFRTLDTRFDDETKIMIELPTTKRVRPMTYVYVEDVLRLRQALSSQGRHEGVTSGSIPELPGVNAVPLPASPDGQRQDDVAELLASIAAIPTTHQDLNYLYVNILHARGSLGRELRREAVVAIKTYRDILEAVRARVIGGGGHE